jgi:hypothetical protein
MRITQNISIAGTATLAPIPVYIAEQDGVVRSADYSCFGATDGVKSLLLRNATQNKDISSALSINGLTALARTPFAIPAQSATVSQQVKKGDVLTATYTVGTAGSVAPGETSIGLVIDDPMALGTGPSWAG